MAKKTSKKCIPLMPFHNGLTAALSRLMQLQADFQCVGVHHVPYSKTHDVWSSKVPIVHRVFEMPFERLLPKFRGNIVENIQTAKMVSKIGAMNDNPMYPRGRTPLQVTPRLPRSVTPLLHVLQFPLCSPVLLAPWCMQPMH